MKLTPWQPNFAAGTKSIFMVADMAKKKATKKLEKQDFASELAKQNLTEDKAQEKVDAKLLQDSINALQNLGKDTVDPGVMDVGYSQLCHEDADDADDELETDDDDDYEEVQPLNIKKTKTGKDSDQGMQ